VTLLSNIKAFSKTRLSWGLLLLSVIFFELSALFFQHVMQLAPCVMCIYERVAMFGIGGAALIGIINPKNTLIRWLGLGAVGLIGGILGALASINDPRAIGGAMAFSLLTMLYSLMLLVSARIVFPSSVLPEGKSSMGVGLMSLTVPMWLFSFFTFVVLVLSMMEV